MRIKTYDDFKHGCGIANGEIFDSAIAIMWKEKSLEYIKQNYSEKELSFVP